MTVAIVGGVWVLMIVLIVRSKMTKETLPPHSRLDYWDSDPDQAVKNILADRKWDDDGKDE